MSTSPGLLLIARPPGQFLSRLAHAGQLVNNENRAPFARLHTLARHERQIECRAESRPSGMRSLDRRGPSAIEQRLALLGGAVLDAGAIELRPSQVPVNADHELNADAGHVARYSLSAPVSTLHGPQLALDEGNGLTVGDEANTHSNDSGGSLGVLASATSHTLRDVAACVAAGRLVSSNAGRSAGLAPERGRLQFQQERRTERAATTVNLFAPHVAVAELPSLQSCVRDRSIRASQALLRHDIKDEVAGYRVTDDDVAGMRSHASTDTPSAHAEATATLHCGKS